MDIRKHFHWVFIPFITAIVIFSFVLNKNYKQIENNIKSWKSELAPDSRTTLAHIEINPSLFRIHIYGETSVHELYHRIINESHSSTFPIRFQVKLLPDISINEKSTAVVHTGVANLRRHPRHQSELVDQVKLGTSLKVLKQEQGWYLIQNPWEYLGWVSGSSLTLFSDREFQEYEISPKVYVTAVNSSVLDKPESASFILRNVTLGATLKYIGISKDHIHVMLPDSIFGFIAKSDITLGVPKITSNKPDFNAIVQTAELFHGIPYLWGGNSSHGMDCSGFTQTVFMSNAYMLPRDANMQVNIGDSVIPTDNFDNIHKGDLIFFGPNPDRITHVGISLGEDRFIHASSYVQINSLLPNNEDYDDYRRSTLQFIKRIN